MMIETLNAETFKFVCAGLPALLEGYFEREEILTSKGLQAFRPALRFIEDFSESENELKEYKDFLIESNKSRVGRTSYNSEKWNTLFYEARQKCLVTRKPWDGEVTSFTRRIQKMRCLDLYSLMELKKKYQDETQSLWRQDVIQFSSGKWQNLEFDKIIDRKKLYLEIFKSWSDKIGLFYDKKLSSTRKPVFSKPFVEPWKLCFEIDTVKFYKPIENEVAVFEQGRSYELNKSGPHFSLSFGLLHNKLKGTSKIPSGKNLMFNLGLFYPIQLALIDSLMYSLFYNLEELGAIVNIQLTLYELMQVDFEAALRKGLLSRDAL